MKNNKKYHISFDLELRRNPYDGIYIALEGIDGSGKTTQVEKLAEYYGAQGREVVKTREPRKEGIVGDLVHEVLKGERKMSAKALQYLFSTDRMLHHEDVIEPSLRDGKVVLSDRCLWSAVVYGILDKSEEYGFESANQILIAHSILSMYHQFIVPDFTFFLNVSLETSLLRIEEKHKESPKEMYEVREKVEKVIKGYGWLMQNFGDEITEIDGEQSIDDVTKEILAKVEVLKK
ncbi:MAG: dTMP kinase [Candidatus Levybacteria bacterium RIFOXYA1_FULL_41_10]|nr:MAG: Thymidylate kinase [Candidatus Levybacteria bacterium GW2011_GWC1_40_19]KKR72196.1 MAG: Thymidylate kinase [Candidatus Levybacteria bacterium GW2011_GWC2_40_7]KKR94610.1 MAG: Thymidylate kinase [Candidatus Levybacteria bacterium GW2011_GWA2_41_15]OGH27018.1 MAG: dTMP kinase [Candidatus Levybacteria bacterium RIFCSPHIGHO2_02_FULL_40_29]OGH31781.1 MAG: dTMP kinase [Candidatus Levybacteria bacterium RIFCSPHIGHO2_12_FULL_40_44]OGH51726.1 MAG: dTMP kinase [Candidatus Levybacteria bacterium 